MPRVDHRGCALSAAAINALASDMKSINNHHHHHHPSSKCQTVANPLYRQSVSLDPLPFTRTTEPVKEPTCSKWEHGVDIEAMTAALAPHFKANAVTEMMSIICGNISEMKRKMSENEKDIMAVEYLLEHLGEKLPKHAFDYATTRLAEWKQMNCDFEHDLKRIEESGVMKYVDKTMKDREENGEAPPAEDLKTRMANFADKMNGKSGGKKKKRGSKSRSSS